VAQAQRFGAEMVTVQHVDRLELAAPSRIVRLTDGTELNARAVIIATGVAYRRLEAPGADDLAGKGVYYGAAMAEAMSCMNEEILLVGGANSAGQAAMYFSRYARRITLLVRGDSLTKSMSRYLVDQIEAAPNVHVRTNTQVVAASGDGRLEAVTVRDGPSGDEETIRTSHLFVFIGATPATEWLGDVVERDERGFILTGIDLLHDGRRPAGWTEQRDPFPLETSVPGIFAAGDVRRNSSKRVASAVGEGAMAVQLVHQYLVAA